MKFVAGKVVGHLSMYVYYSFFPTVEKRPQKEKKDERKAEVVPAL